MVRRRLDPERHGADGYTTIPRVIGVAACMAFVGVALHLVLGSWYDGKIMPGVVAAGLNVGGMNVGQARAALQKEASSYRLRLTVAGQKYQASAQDLGVSFDTEPTLASAYAAGRGGWFPKFHTDPVPMEYKLNRTQLVVFASSVADRVGVQPVDAGVVVKDGQLETVADKSGVTIDKLGLARLVEHDLAFPSGDSLQLKPRALLADIQVTALAPTIEAAKLLMATPIVLTYQDKTYTPTSTDIGQWLAFEKQDAGSGAKLAPKVDVAKLKSYVQSIANEADVASVAKKVTIENGVSKTTQEGVNGLAIDQDAAVNAIATAVAKNEALTFAVTTHEVPFKTIANTLVTLDYGRYIEINLRSQHLWVWQDHNVIYDSPITSGAAGAGFPTVTGLFSIYYKTTNTHLVGNAYGPRYNYDVFVKYWMPFHSGFGMHDASWRGGNFGGGDYYYGGSHGCVNLPDATAAFIYNWSSVGTPVWVHN